MAYVHDGDRWMRRAGVTPVDVAMVVGAVAVGAVFKSVTGLGLPVVAVPIMAIRLGVETSVVVIGIPALVANVWQGWLNLDGAAASRHLPVMAVTGAVTTTLGAGLLDSLSERTLALVLAGTISLYVVVFVAHPQLELTRRVTGPTAPFVGAAAGLMQGAIGASGPILGTYLHGFRLPRPAYLFSTSCLFLVFGVVQVATLAALGLYNSGRLVASLLAVVPVVAIFPVGLRLGSRVEAGQFERIALAGLVVAAAITVANAV